MFVHNFTSTAKNVLLVGFLVLATPAALKALNGLNAGNQLIENTKETKISCGSCKVVCGCKEQKDDQNIEETLTDGAKTHHDEIH